jgi:regulator of protease activity HflC (stomatin/prohibitin superfamily)
VRIVVQEWERVLLYRDGRFAEVLGPGSHRRLRWRRSRVRVSLRPRLLTVAGQEVLTADGVSVKASLLVRCRVDDPRRWHEDVDDADAFLYGALQVAVRESIGTRSLDDLLSGRTAVGAEVATAVEAAATGLGLVVEDVAVRDLMVPVELRRAAVEAATARAQGAAALERARGEVAATRALVNAARLVAEHPGLLQLRTLQAVEAGRATVVLPAPGVPPTTGVPAAG